MSVSDPVAVLITSYLISIQTARKENTQTFVSSKNKRKFRNSMLKIIEIKLNPLVATRSVRQILIHAFRRFVTRFLDTRVEVDGRDVGTCLPFQPQVSIYQP
jgi:cytidylate kinase